MVIFAADTPAPDALGDALKIVQIAFYTVAGFIAVLTYLAARKAWLTPTNTEYQKRVMDRLAKLSEELYAEFDQNSPTHWASARAIHSAVKEISATFVRNRDEALAAKKWYYGTPVAKNLSRLRDLLHPLRSDPFIPENIRAAVIDLLENRLHVMDGLYLNEFEKYADGLAKGKHEPLDEDDGEDLEKINKIHNRIIDHLNEQGCGITAIENAVHDIRGHIQDYFDAFSPHGVGTGRRARHEQTPEPPG